MNLFGLQISKAPKNNNAATGTSSPQLRPNNGQGPYTSYFRSFVARKVEASFYEFLREAIPIIDAAIVRLVNLEGHIVVKGNNDKLVEELRDWIKNVPVNDMQTGLQAFHQNMSNEAFEQGFTLAEYITDRKRSDIVQLRVADSKYIKFARTDTGLDIYQKADSDHDWRKLNTANLLYFSINNENQNPYGTPLMRSCEFVAKILVTIQNAVMNSWERFGDPSFCLIYQTNKRDAGELETRRKVLETELNYALRDKREGKSADFVRAIHQDAKITLEIIGANGQVLEMEVPARHMIEQIVAKTGMPPWMLGLHWSTTERLANFETEMLLGDIKTRQAAKMPHFERLIKTLLLLRGRTWKPGDWWLEWELVNLHDVVQQAQARFLNAQADMYYLQNAAAAGIELRPEDLALGKKRSSTGILPVTHRKDACDCGSKELRRPFVWQALDKIESEFETRLKSDWKEMETETLAVLRLSEKALTSGGTKEDTPEGVPSLQFTFTAEQKSRILQNLKDFIGKYDPENPESHVSWFYGRAYSEGLLQAVKIIGKDRPKLDIIHNAQVFEKLASDGFTLVKDNATKAILEKILPEMEAQTLAGTNPRHVAARLQKLFADKNTDWERLARSEMNLAAESAKLDEWAEWDIKEVEFVPAPDACAICLALAGKYPIKDCPVPVADTHPRCRCSTRPARE